MYSYKKLSNDIRHAGRFQQLFFKRKKVYIKKLDDLLFKTSFRSHTLGEHFYC